LSSKSSSFTAIALRGSFLRYLMVAVGCLFIRSGEGSSKELLKDLVEVS
jgi:hypothetical protein